MNSFFSGVSIPQPNPLLPKSYKIYDQPPECPLSSIKFKVLSPFKEFENNWPDQLGQNFHGMSGKHFGRPIDQKLNGLGDN